MKITTNHRVELLDICLPDYFTGYHLPVLAVPIYGTMTNKDIAKAIDSELNAIWDYINPEDNEEITALYETYIAKLNETPRAIFFQAEIDSNDIAIMEYDYEDQECLYAYFSIINPVTVYGLNFLNP